MRTSVRSFFFILVLSLSSSSWSMNDRCGLPSDIWLEMFRYLELRNILNVLEASKSYKALAEHDSFWANLSLRFYGDKVDKIKRVDEKWRQVFQRVFCLDKRLIDIDPWTKEELLDVDRNFTWYLERLLKTLKVRIVNHAELKCKSSKDFLAAILAYIAVDMCTLMYYEINFLGSSIDNEWKAAAESTSTGTVKFMASWNSIFAQDGSFDAAYNDVKQAANDFRLKLTAESKINNDDRKLARLFILAYISQKDLYRHFDRAFNDAKLVLDGEANFNMSLSDISSSWADCALPQERIHNQWIATFYWVLEELMRKCEERPAEDVIGNH
jgi:hypothetical protein